MVWPPAGMLFEISSPKNVPQPHYGVIRHQFWEVSYKPRITLQLGGIGDRVRRMTLLDGLTDMRFESSINVNSDRAVGPFGR